MRGALQRLVRECARRSTRRERAEVVWRYVVERSGVGAPWEAVEVALDVVGGVRTREGLVVVMTRAGQVVSMVVGRRSPYRVRMYGRLGRMVFGQPWNGWRVVAGRLERRGVGVGVWAVAVMMVVAYVVWLAETAELPSVERRRLESLVAGRLGGVGWRDAVEALADWWVEG